MKGKSKLFFTGSNARGTLAPRMPIPGVDFNQAGSKDVRKVDNVSTISAHSMPTESSPNTVVRNYKNGELVTERYFDETGTPYLDIDYTSHGNSTIHQSVPHQHKIWIENGHFKRDDQEDI